MPSRRLAVSRSFSMAKDCTFSSVNSERSWLYEMSPARRILPARYPTNTTTRTTSSRPVAPNRLLSKTLRPLYPIHRTPCQLWPEPMEMASSIRPCTCDTGMYGSRRYRLS